MLFNLETLLGADFRNVSWAYYGDQLFDLIRFLELPQIQIALRLAASAL